MYSDQDKPESRKMIDILEPYMYLPFAKGYMPREKKERMVREFHPDRWREPKTKEEKHPKCIDEPRPGANHVICAICREQFKDYIEHIFSSKHSRGVINNAQIFGEIDKVI